MNNGEESLFFIRMNEFTKSFYPEKHIMIHIKTKVTDLKKYCDQLKEEGKKAFKEENFSKALYIYNLLLQKSDIPED
jgi:hypothetical protein